MDKLEEKYYSRQVILPEVGETGQQKLKDARVLIVGAGGLGSPVLQYLCGAGVGKIGIVDGDVVDISNLHRQTIYHVTDVGSSKALTAAKRLVNLNPFLDIVPYNVALSVFNVRGIFNEYDIIVDCTDNYPARYLINDACVLMNKVLVSASIFRFEGQMSVYNYKGGPTYRCLFPVAPTGASVTNCQEAGVLGVLPGIMGLYQANEVIKIILGFKDIMSGRLMVFNALKGNTMMCQLVRNMDYSQLLQRGVLREEDYLLPQCEIQENLIDLHPEALFEHPEKHRFVIVDVREPGEEPVVERLDLIRIPVGLMRERISEIPGDRIPVFFCRSGMRSRKAAQIFLELNENKKAYNLVNGITRDLIEQWKRQ